MHDESHKTDRLSEDGPLAQRIRGAAYNVARRNDADPDDVEQEIYLAILERFEADPEFLDETDAYIVNHGAWKATDVLRGRRLRTERDTATCYAGDGNDLRNDALTTDPWSDVNARLSTPDLAMLVSQVLAGLEDETDQAIAKALMEGHKPAKIARQVGCSRRNVYYRMEVVKGEFLRADVRGAALAA